MSAAPPMRWETLKTAMACPTCHGPLDFSSDHANCSACDIRFPIRAGKIYFRAVATRDDRLDRIKGRLKTLFGQYYYKIGVTIFAPTFPFSFGRAVRRYVDADRDVVINVGCGNHRVDPRWVGIDIFDYDAVDIVADLERLPFADGTIVAIVSRSVLEHLPRPGAVADEIERVVRPGGYTMHLAPFLFPFHASPYDFYRFSHIGIRQLFERWQLRQQFNATGPVTLIVAVAAEWLSRIGSFAGERVVALLYLLACGVLFPVKYLDVFFVRQARFLTVAPTIFSVFQKPDRAPA